MELPSVSTRSRDLKTSRTLSSPPFFSSWLRSQAWPHAYQLLHMLEDMRTGSWGHILMARVPKGKEKYHCQLLYRKSQREAWVTLGHICTNGWGQMWGVAKWLPHQNDKTSGFGGERGSSPKQEWRQVLLLKVLGYALSLSLPRWFWWW